LLAEQRCENEKNAVSWDVTPCGFYNSRRFGGKHRPIIRVKRINELGTTLSVTSKVILNVIPRSPILFTLLMEAILSSETSVLIRASRRHIPEDGILHHHRSENLKSYIAINGWAL
jgi:hypothetical protein